MVGPLERALSAEASEPIASNGPDQDGGTRPQPTTTNAPVRGGPSAAHLAQSDLATKASLALERQRTQYALKLQLADRLGLPRDLIDKPNFTAIVNTRAEALGLKLKIDGATTSEQALAMAAEHGLPGPVADALTQRSIAQPSLGNADSKAGGELNNKPLSSKISKRRFKLKGRPRGLRRSRGAEERITKFIKTAGLIAPKTAKDAEELADAVSQERSNLETRHAEVTAEQTRLLERAAAGQDLTPEELALIDADLNSANIELFLLEEALEVIAEVEEWLYSGEWLTDLFKELLQQAQEVEFTRRADARTDDVNKDINKRVRLLAEARQEVKSSETAASVGVFSAPLNSEALAVIMSKADTIRSVLSKPSPDGLSQLQTILQDLRFGGGQVVEISAPAPTPTADSKPSDNNGPTSAQQQQA